MLKVFTSIIILLNGTLHSSLRVGQKSTCFSKCGCMNLIKASFSASLIVMTTLTQIWPSHEQVTYSPAFTRVLEYEISFDASLSLSSLYSPVLKSNINSYFGSMDTLFTPSFNFRNGCKVVKGFGTRNLVSVCYVKAFCWKRVICFQ